MAVLKVRTIPLSSVIRFGSEQEPLNLVDITSDIDGQAKSVTEFLSSPGSFIYETRFTVDEYEAFKQGVTGIRFQFFASKPDAGDVPLKENDFTVEIRQPPLSNEPDLSNIQKAAIFLKSPSMTALSQVALPLSAISLQQPIAPAPFKDAARAGETINKKDPAQSLASGKVLGTTPKNVLNFGVQSYVPAQKSQNFDTLGTKSSDRHFSLAQSRKSLKESRQSIQDSVVNSFLNLKQIVDPASLVRTLPVAMVEVLSRSVEYTRQLAFEKKNLMGFNKLYVRVSGIVRDEAIASVEKRTFVIPHSAEISDFLGNPEPPTIISSESSFGRASFLLRRNDPTLRRVAVIRITKNPNLVNSVFERLADIEFGDVDSVEFSDSVDNVAPNTVIYRFIVQNEDGSSGDFVSSVLTSFTKVSDQKKVLTSTTPISIRALNTVDGISVDVDTINDQVYSLRLLRQDFGLIGEFSNTVKTILDSNGRYSQIVAGEKSTYSFLDTDVIPGRHYRYFAAYRLGTGAAASLCQETLSDEDEIIVRLRPSATSPFLPAVTPAFASQDENNSVTIQFETSVQEVENQFNTLLDSLRQAGVSQQFISDLQNDRQKIRQVAAFLIERVDRVTGRRTSFGIYSPGKFFDSPETRSKLGIPDPIPGRKYEYICKLCIRPDATFLLTATTGFTATGDASGNITEVLAAKFQSSLISRGILPSEKRLREGVSIRENFFLGLTGEEISSSVTVPFFAPSVENVTVKEKKTYNLLRWNTSGDVSSVSYFLVYCNYNGNDELLGAVSSLGTNSVYQYKDTRFYDEVGQKSYFVKIVTLDHDVSVSSPKVETLTEFSIPAAVLDGFILSPSRYEVKGAVLPGPGPQFPKPGVPLTPAPTTIGSYSLPTAQNAVSYGKVENKINTDTIKFDTQTLLEKPGSLSKNQQSEIDFYGKKIAGTSAQKQPVSGFQSVPPIAAKNDVLGNFGKLIETNNTVKNVDLTFVGNGYSQPTESKSINIVTGFLEQKEAQKTILDVLSKAQAATGAQKNEKKSAAVDTSVGSLTGGGAGKQKKIF